ncbi:hypothetical protein GCM10010430_78980 [Kitasatospora cystarginea]|uniref:Uncharacterized protein n=1 Tax=Kitasatospora cystarginea TaxID=58350 RepID=A0ABN3F375_9ACTN
MFKKLASIAAIVSSIAGGTVLAAPAAHAEPLCSGSVIDTYDVKDSWGTVASTITLFYDPATRNNCAYNSATSAGGAGSPHGIGLTLDACEETSPSDNCTPIAGQAKSDAKSTYSWYAGPLTVYAPGHCVYVSGSNNYNHVLATFSTGATHCG